MNDETTINLDEEKEEMPEIPTVVRGKSVPEHFDNYDTLQSETPDPAGRDVEKKEVVDSTAVSDDPKATSKSDVTTDIQSPSPSSLSNPSNLGKEIPNLPKETKGLFNKCIIIVVTILLATAIGYWIYTNETSNPLESNESIEINNSYDIDVTPTISSPVTSTNHNKYNNTFNTEINLDLDEELLDKLCANYSS